MHCAHRNPSVPPYGFTTEMIITDSAIHEIDLVRWMFDEDIAAATVLRPRRTRQAAEPWQIRIRMVWFALEEVAVVRQGFGRFRIHTHTHTSRAITGWNAPRRRHPNRPRSDSG